MITYKDRAYCGSKEHKPYCDRQITKEELKQAEEMGLPVAYAPFCDEAEEEADV